MDRALIIGFKHVPKLRPICRAHEPCYGCAPEAHAAPVSSFQLLGGCEVQLVEAHGAEVHHGDEVGAASGKPARRLDQLSRARLLLAASASSSHLPTKRVPTAEKEGCLLVRVLHVPRS